MSKAPGPGDKPTPEKPEISEEEAARKRQHDEELYGDLDDEEETPEEIRKQRDELLEDKIRITGRLGESQQERLRLQTQLEAQKVEAAAALARTQRQVDEQKDFALEKFIKEVLPVVDNLERGLAAIPAAQRAADPKFEKLAQGMEKTLGQLSAVFNKFGIKAIDPKGQPFDPEKHEAVSTNDDADVESDTVVEVAQKGYELNGRVIRPARVVVKP